MTFDPNQSKDYKKLTQAELVNTLARMTVDQARSVLPELSNYFQNRKRVWAALRDNLPIPEGQLEQEASIMILLFQSQEWSKKEIEKKILEIFGRIQEQDEIIHYEISQKLL